MRMPPPTTPDAPSPIKLVTVSIGMALPTPSMVQSLLWAGPTGVQGARSGHARTPRQEDPRLFWVEEEYRSLLRAAELRYARRLLKDIAVETSTDYRGGSGFTWRTRTTAADAMAHNSCEASHQPRPRPR